MSRRRRQRAQKKAVVRPAPLPPPSSSRLRRWLVILIVTCVLAAGAVAAIRAPAVVQSTRWGFTWAITTQDLFRIKPKLVGRLLDEEIYLGTMHRVAEGEGYYAAHHAMLQLNPGLWDTHSPLTYRQPLLTYLWVLMGAGGAIGIAWATIAVSSTVAAWVVSERLVNGGWPAVLAPFGLALVYIVLQLHPPRILYSEMWAGPMISLAAALCALVILSDEATRTKLWLFSSVGALVAFIAMLFRELALPFVIVMCFALLVDRRTRDLRLWLPWAAAVIAWIGAYAVHVSRVHAVALNDPPYPVSQGDLIASYFHPGFSFLGACVRWISGNAVLLPLVSTLGILALIGAARLRERALLTLVGGVTFGSLAALTLTGTFGVFADGNYTGYWGYLFIPPVLAWSPLGISRVIRQRISYRGE